MSLRTPSVLSPSLLHRLADTAAKALREAGVRSGEHVVLQGPTGAPYLATLLALWRLGAVAVPLSTRLPEATLPPLLERIRARWLVGDTETPLSAEVRQLSFPMLHAGPSRQEAPFFDTLDLDTRATLVFTSGSTGTPKAALHALGNHVWSARGSNENIPLTPGDGWLLALPLYHVGGLGILFRCLVAGANVVLPAPGETIEDTLRRPETTHVSLVATQLLRLLRNAPDVLSGLKATLLGGSAIPPALLDEAVLRGLPVHTSYGLTEMASQVTTTPPGASREALGSSGRLLPHRELRIAVDGEILVRGRTRFLGYLDGDVLQTPFDPDGWYATGDTGRLDADGYLHVTGRKDFLFISGGENVQPDEVERALLGIEGVLQAVVVPVPDEEFGHRPVAFIEASRPLDGAHLRASLEAVLPRFKIPVAYLPLPEAGGMKPDREALAMEAARWKVEGRT